VGKNYLKNSPTSFVKSNVISGHNWWCGNCWFTLRLGAVPRNGVKNRSLVYPNFSQSGRTLNLSCWNPRSPDQTWRTGNCRCEGSLNWRLGSGPIF